MAKDDKKDNKKANKGNTGEAATGDSWLAPEARQPGTYSDGHPLDSVQYLEAKLILKPDRFVSVESFRDFGKLVQRTARNLAVGFVTDPKVGCGLTSGKLCSWTLRTFASTTTLLSCGGGSRISTASPSAIPRSSSSSVIADEKKAAELDVRPISWEVSNQVQGRGASPQRPDGGFRMLYSHNCQFGLSQMHEADAWECGDSSGFSGALRP